MRGPQSIVDASEQQRGVVLVCGTRPEIIKCAPLYHALNAEGLPATVLLTGQHAELAEGLPEFFGLDSVVRLKSMRKSPSVHRLLSSLLDPLDEALEGLNPRAVVVQGDTTSSLAGGLVASGRGLPIAHLEAGLRTGIKSSPFPEEINRRLLATLADLHLAPTLGAQSNLVSEGCDPSTIHVIGNTSVDGLVFALRRLADVPTDSDRIAVTLHRRESWSEGLSDVAAAIRALSRHDSRLRFDFVMHANPVLQARVRESLGDQPAVRLLPPLMYPDFIQLLRGCSMILTDSGGIQEEAPTLRVPTVILRDQTERPEAVACGACRIAGTNPTKIIDVVLGWRSSIAAGTWAPPEVNPFGDGFASTRGAEAIVAMLGREHA